MVKRRSTERKVAGSIPGRTNTQGLKITEDEGATSGLQTVRPLRGSDDHVEMAVPSPVGDVKTLLSISTFLLNTLTLK